MRRLALLLLAVVLACGGAAAWQTDSLYYANGSENPHTISSSGAIQYPGLWISNATITAGLVHTDYRSAPTIFQKDSIWYLVAGGSAGQFTGYNWTGSTDSASYPNNTVKTAVMLFPLMCMVLSAYVLVNLGAKRVAGVTQVANIVENGEEMTFTITKKV